MAYNYTYNPQLSSAAAPTPQQQLGMLPAQQNVQPLFPQPQGNVYNINSTVEVANVPVGAGISVALCMPESIMYIKTMQNGNPLFYPYRIVPFNAADSAAAQTQSENSNQEDPIIKMEEQIKKCNERITDLEALISKKRKEGDWA